MSRCTDCPELPNGTRKRQICCRREGAQRRFVGEPGPGQRVCERCKGNGQLSRYTGQYPTGYPPCGRCAGTGVLPLRLSKGDKVPHVPPPLHIRPAFTGAGSPSFKPARHAKLAPGR